MLKVTNQEVIICGNHAELHAEFATLVKRLLKAGVSEREMHCIVKQASGGTKEITQQRITEKAIVISKETDDTLDFLREIFNV